MVTKKRKNMKGRPRGGASVPCPKCGKDSHVIITRRTDGEVTRTRECHGRHAHSFRTIEQAV